MGITPCGPAALTRLETEGLADRSQRGVKITSVPLWSCGNCSSIRSRLEALAAVLACPHLDGSGLSKARRLYA